MDRRFTALAGVLGFTWWRSRKKRAVLAPPPPQADPADELRAKLADAREHDDRDEFESGEKPVDDAVNAADVDAKRRDAHDRARAATDDLRPE